MKNTFFLKIKVLNHTIKYLVVFRSSIALLIPATLTAIVVGFSVKSVTAQTIYGFDTNYNTTVNLTPIPGSNIFRADVSGTNPDAPYGLTNFTSLNYSLTKIQGGIPISITFNPDPASFGLTGLPIGIDRFFGSGNDQLFAISNATAKFDPNNQLVGSGTETITGGSGRFTGATGTLNFSESEPLNADPNAPLHGQAFLTGSFQTAQVLEPKTDMGILSIGAIGLGFLLRRYGAKVST